MTARVEDDALHLDLFGGGSGPVPNGEDPLEAVFQTIDHLQPLTCVFGAVSKQVEGVEVEFSDGIRLPAVLRPGVGWDVDFFAICRSEDTPHTQIVLLDGDGNVIPIPDVGGG